jgi:hypothetical protein
MEIELLLLLIKEFILFLVLDGAVELKDWQRFEEVSLVLAGLAPFSTFCTYYCIDGLCYFCNTRMAYNNFPPYFVAGAVFSGFAMVNTAYYHEKSI